MFPIVAGSLTPSGKFELHGPCHLACVACQEGSIWQKCRHLISGLRQRIQTVTLPLASVHFVQWKCSGHSCATVTCRHLKVTRENLGHVAGKTTSHCTGCGVKSTSSLYIGTWSSQKDAGMLMCSCSGSGHIAQAGWTIGLVGLRRRVSELVTPNASVNSPAAWQTTH